MDDITFLLRETMIGVVYAVVVCLEVRPYLRKMVEARALKFVQRDISQLWSFFSECLLIANN